MSSLGSFAARNQSQTSPARSSLLPHELEARKRATSHVADPAAQPDSIGRQSMRHGQNRGGRPPSNKHQAKAEKSKSILADILKTIRQPQKPATPKSWLDGSQQTPSDAESAQAGAKTTSASEPRASPQKATSTKSSESAHGGAQRQTAWGAFSNRKAQTPSDDPTRNRGKTASRWSENSRFQKKSGSKASSKDETSSPALGGEPAVQDFWSELDTRVADIRDSASKKPKQNPSKGKSHDATPGVDAHSASQDRERWSQRRSSRFEMEDAPKVADRQAKKFKGAGRSRLLQSESDWDSEAVHRWEQKKRRKAEKAARKAAEDEQQPSTIPIFLPEYINAFNLAQALKQRPERFLSDMEEMGFENVTPDTIMTGETAALISMEYGFEPTVDNGSQRDLKPRPAPDDVALLPSRPPVVTIMGHVDHGKTTLLDWLRKSSVAAQEHGGITQHIGAFVVKMSTGKQITFLDTPGHAAFLSMRQRGANVTDIVVLVVAADDSVMPQTLEALKHAKAAKVPIIVAINKIDKEDARVDQVKADLARHGIEIEDFGGDVQVVCVSGKTGQGMADLEENIVTLSEILDVRAESDGMAEGWVLESSVKQDGRAATVLVKRGTLRPGDLVVAGKTWARIRLLRNEAGSELTEAPPGTPVEMLGWRELPDAGEQVLQAPDEGKAKTAVEYRLEMAEREESSVQLAEQEQRQREKAAAAAAAAEASTVSSGSAEQEGGTAAAETGIIYQNFTVRADVVGSVEAVCSSVLELGNYEVRAKILRSAAGPVSEYDVDHAAASKSVIINFNSPVLPHIKQRAEDAKVKILDHNVIYHVVDDAKATLSALLPMSVTVRVNGEADILQIFPINITKRVFRNIAGCRVRNGSVKKSSLVRVLRKGEVVFDGE